MLHLPCDVLASGVLVHLSIRDLQAVNVAFTSTPTHRARIKELWKSYPYECIDGRVVSLNELKWLRSVDVKPFGLIVEQRYNTVDIVSYIASNFPSLRKLQVSSAFDYGLDDDSLKKLAQGCPRLELLRIPCSDITDAGILALVQTCRQLHTLSIHDIARLFHHALQDSTIEIICSYWPNLKHIGLSNCSDLTDTSLIAIANTYPHLQSIHLCFCNFTHNGLMHIAAKCHELQSISVSGDNITFRGLTTLWAANPNLMDVNISNNELILDDDIIQLLQCCPLLQKLNISDCNNITDAAVIAVAGHCPQLRSLNISYCYDLSDASLIALGQHCHEVKSINISYLKKLSDVGIAALAAGCPLLQEFSAHDSSVTDAATIALARRCRDLCEIDVSGASIGSAAVSAIAENCPLISQLCISYCTRVDDACLYAIAQHCRNLTILNIDDDNLTRKALLVVESKCKNLRRRIF